MRKKILKWLFQYNMPQYFEAIQFYKNISWDRINENGTNKQIIFNGFYISESKITREVIWHIRNSNDPNDQGGTIWNYSDFIMKLHDIIHFGIIVKNGKS